MPHPDPENSVSSMLTELDELYSFHWDDVNEAPSIAELAKACDEVRKWARQVKGETYQPEGVG